MRVRSPLADIDLEVGTIEREQDRLVVHTAEGVGIPTRIDIDARDAVRILRTVLFNRHALGFALCLPVLYWRARKHQSQRSANINNPWDNP